MKLFQGIKARRKCHIILKAYGNDDSGLSWFVVTLVLLRSYDNGAQWHLLSGNRRNGHPDMPLTPPRISATQKPPNINFVYFDGL